MFEAENWIELWIFFADKVLHLNRSNLNSTSQKLTKLGRSSGTGFLKGGEGAILNTLAYFEQTHLVAASCRLLGTTWKYQEDFTFRRLFHNTAQLLKVCKRGYVFSIKDGMQKRYLFLENGTQKGTGLDF